MLNSATTEPLQPLSTTQAAITIAFLSHIQSLTTQKFSFCHSTRFILASFHGFCHFHKSYIFIFLTYHTKSLCFLHHHLAPPSRVQVTFSQVFKNFPPPIHLKAWGSIKRDLKCVCVHSTKQVYQLLVFEQHNLISGQLVHLSSDRAALWEEQRQQENVAPSLTLSDVRVWGCWTLVSVCSKGELFEPAGSALEWWQTLGTW